MSSIVATGQVDRFYRAAMVGLAALDGRTTGSRRFGGDADARWKSFQGGLKDWHRIDLLVRDAAVRFPAAFAPRVVFDLPALAVDEPYGPDWPGATPIEAADLLRAGGATPADLHNALSLVADAWSLTMRPLAPQATADIQPATRLLLAGAGAVQSVASVFAGRADLDLADQSVLVADDPGTRQLFGVALAILDSRRPNRVVASGATAADVHALGLGSVDRALLSDEVPADIRDRALTLARDLGARE